MISKIVRPTSINNFLLKLLSAFILAIVFSQTPVWLAQVMPASYYYHWRENPFTMTKTVYSSCEPLQWKVERTNKIISRAIVSERIQNGAPVLDRKIDAQINDPFKWSTIYVEWDIGCLPAGKYHLDGIITFWVNGIEKQYVYKSYEFEIKDTDIYEFINEGDRFTFCDGVYLYNKFNNMSIKLPDSCINRQTKFIQLINKYE